MYPLSLILHDFARKALESKGLDIPPETERFTRPVPFDAGGPYDQTPACNPTIIGHRLHSCWLEARETTTGQWQMREMEIQHRLFAKPVVINTAFANSQDEVFSRSKEWVERRHMQPQWQEVVSRPAAKTPGHFSRMCLNTFLNTVHY